MAAYCRVYDMRVSLWAWWEVVAAHHQVHNYAYCLQTFSTDLKFDESFKRSVVKC